MRRLADALRVLSLSADKYKIERLHRKTSKDLSEQQDKVFHALCMSKLDLELIMPCLALILKTLAPVTSPGIHGD